MKQQIFLPVLLLILLFTSCSPAYKKYLSNYSFNNSDTKPDYNLSEYWAAAPFKKSLSDSVPEPLRNDHVKDTMVDVFFIHPTTFTAIENADWNASINDPKINAKTDYSTILYQASAFNEYRLFAPRYRQANLKAYFTKDTVRAHEAFDLAYEDVKTAFQYYLDHYNNGHPIIIASHSQGSTHAKRLLKEFFENKPLQKKLVAAYVIGMVIPENYFTALQPCRDSLQTGCVIGWRTFKKGFTPGFVKHEQVKSLTVNPLNWTTGNEYAEITLNKGGILKNFNTLIPELADAQIHEGILWTNKPKLPLAFLYKSKNYHIGDINLFYQNIRMNLRTRVHSFESH